VASRLNKLKEVLPLSRISIDLLLALRFLYDTKDDVVDLKQDISDLSVVPERLSDSYRQEWEAYVLRAIVLDMKDNEDIEPTLFINSILERVEKLKTESDALKTLSKQVEQADAINSANNTCTFPSPWRQQLMTLLLPIAALDEPPSKT
jgi:hypothetical protein